MTFMQIYLLIGTAVFLLPFLVERGTPAQWKPHSFAYRIILTMLIVLLWPICFVSFFLAVFRIVRGYIRVRRLMRDVILGEMVTEMIKAAKAHKAEQKAKAATEAAK